MVKSLYVVLLFAILTFLTGCGDDSPAPKSRALGGVAHQVSVGSGTATGCSTTRGSGNEVVYYDFGDKDTKTNRHYDHNQPPHVEIHVDKTTIYECQSIRFDSRGSYDPDGEITEFTWISQDGTVVSTEPAFDHQICYSGHWRKTLVVKDDDGEDASRTIDVIVKKYPTVEDQNFRIAENTPVDITLFGRDSYGSDVTYHVVTNPSNGTLSGTAPNLTYTPNAGYSGTDSFKFKVKNDDGVYSREGEITISITPDSTSNLAPTAIAQSVTMNKNSSRTIVLDGTDPNGDSLTYHVVTYPTNGTLDINGSTVVYAPNANYIGTDSFTFRVNDGIDNSPAATVDITISDTPVPNQAPEATPQSVSLNENSSTVITLAGTDAECDPLTYHVVTYPVNGTLTGTTPNLTYTPNADYSGTDSFTFMVNDGELDSEVVTVSIVVNEIADTTPPVITLLGDATINLLAGDTYIDAGATANDNKDGDITGSIVTLNPVNTTVAGTYTVTYNVSDAAGNAATQVSRTVTVPPATDAYATWLLAKNNLVHDITPKIVDGNTVTVLIDPNSQIGEDDTSLTKVYVVGKINGTDMGIGINQNYVAGIKMVVRIYDSSGNVLATSEELAFIDGDTNVIFNEIIF